MHFKKPAGDEITLDYATDFAPERALTGVKVIFSLARTIGETPVLVKKNVAAGGADAQITTEVVGSILRGAVFVLPNDTRNLLGEYEWDLVVQTTDGLETTIAGGTIAFQPRVTRQF